MAAITTKMTITLEEAYKSIQLAHKAMMAVCMFSSPGLGKTSLVYQMHWEANAEARKICAEMGVAFDHTLKYRPDVIARIRHCYVGLCEFNVATANLMDVIGFLIPYDLTIMLEGGQSYTMKAGRFTFPFWMIDKFTGEPCLLYKHGYLLMDEFGQGDPNVKRGTATIIEERRAGEHFLPLGWNIVCCSNRAEDQSGVTRNFGFIINRWDELYIRADLNAWMRWAVKNQVNEFCLGFAAGNTEVVFNGKMPEDMSPWCTPRSFVKAGRVVDAAIAENMELRSTPVVAALNGCIGPGATTTFLSYVDLRDKLPTKDEIIANPTTARLPGDLPASRMIAYSMAMSADRSNIDAFCTYAHRLNKSMGAAFVSATLERDRRLAHAGALSQWVAKNPDIIAAIAG